MAKFGLFFVLAIIFFQESTAYPAFEKIDRPYFYSRLGFPLTGEYEEFLRSYLSSERYPNFEISPLDYYNAYFAAAPYTLAPEEIPIEYPAPVVPIGFGLPMNFSTSTIRDYFIRLFSPLFRRYGEGFFSVPQVIHGKESIVFPGDVPEFQYNVKPVAPESYPHVEQTKEGIVQATVLPAVVHQDQSQVEQTKEGTVQATVLPAVVHQDQSQVEQTKEGIAHATVLPTILSEIVHAVQPHVEEAVKGIVQAVTVLPAIVDEIQTHVEQTKQ